MQKSLNDKLHLVFIHQYFESINLCINKQSTLFVSAVWDILKCIP